MPYVDVNKLITYFQGEWDWHDCQCVKKFAEEGEFEPVIHAHWKLKEPTHEFSEQICTCTNCGYPMSRWNLTKRCPECGAYMDEV